MQKAEKGHTELTTEAVLERLSAEKQKLSQRFGITALGLFGSFARGEATATSDIDLVIDFPPGTPQLSEKKQALRDYLVSVFGRSVDLCRLKYVRNVFRGYIEEDLIYV